MAGELLSGKHPTQSKQITWSEKLFSDTELKQKLLHYFLWEHVREHADQNYKNNDSFSLTVCFFKRPAAYVDIGPV